MGIHYMMYDKLMIVVRQINYNNITYQNNMIFKINMKHCNVINYSVIIFITSLFCVLTVEELHTLSKTTHTRTLYMV